MRFPSFPSALPRPGASPLPVPLAGQAARRGQPGEARAAHQARATPLDLGLLYRVRQGLERMT